MKKILLISLLAVVSVLSGCATIVSGTSQNVNVQVVDSNHHLITDAKCNLTDGNGVSYLVSSNPGSVILPRVYGGLNVYCTAPGYYQNQIGLGSSFNAWVVADVLFWPGAIVDAATGAAKKYPSHITVIMSRHPVKHPMTKIKAHS